MALESQSPAILRFGTFEVDLRAGELRKQGVRIKLQDQPFQVLTVLLQRPGEVVTREELRSQNWPPDTYVDFDNSLNTAINKLREALGDSADNPRFIETLPRRGYRFIAPVSGATAAKDVRVAAKSPAKSVAVLYFENLSGAKEDEYFRDGMTEDIITELAKIRSLQVFPRAAVAAHRDKLTTAPEVAERLNARYVLGGSLRRAGNRLRITVQLVETQTGRSVWGERYDREMKDIFEIQEEIAHSIAQALSISLSPQEENTIARKPTENLQAYDFFLRGRSYARRQNREFALQMFEHALQLDPDFALAHAGIANVCGMQFYQEDRHHRWIERGIAAVSRALELDPQLPEAFVARARISYALDKYAEAEDYARMAIGRRPDCEGSWDILGRALFASDRWQEAADLVEQALEANGDDYNVYVPYGSALTALGQTEASRKLIVRAVKVLEQQVQLVPEDTRARILLACYYAELGQPTEAVRELEKVLALGSTDPHTFYNMACAYALLQMKEEALAMLKKAAEMGYSEWDLAPRDPDLTCIREEPEFRRLLKEAKHKE
jgi:TolB-like protein/cytochrome c-type biogenesis protein CcmH/NrfG